MKPNPFSTLLIVSAAVAALISLPVASVLSNVFSGGTGATWQHLASTVLPDYLVNTLGLCLGVGLGVIVVGVATAWLTAMHDFPGRRIFEWALVLPLAVPAYVLAYVYTRVTVRDEQTARAVLAALFFTGAGQAFMGLVQFAVPFGPGGFAIGPFMRAHGMFGQPNPFAGYLGTIFPITLAVQHRLTVDDVAEAFTIYPSLTGSIGEVARMGHHRRLD